MSFTENTLKSMSNEELVMVHKRQHEMFDYLTLRQDELDVIQKTHTQVHQELNTRGLNTIVKLRDIDSTLPSVCKSYETKFISKSEDQDERIVMSIVLEPGSPEDVDAHNEFVSAETIKSAAYTWMSEYQIRGLQHKEEVNSEVDVYESYIAPTDLTIEGVSVKKGTWLMTYHIKSDQIWKDIKDGKLTGLSIGGYARGI